MKLINLKCRNCGADLEIDPEKNQMYCSFCGAKLLIDDESIHITNRIVDEARLKEAEVRLKELEYQREKDLRGDMIRREQRKASVMSVGVFLLVLLISYALPDLRQFSVLVLVFGGIALAVSRAGDRRSLETADPSLPSRKNRAVALLLCFFTGLIGGHYFYVGRFGMGILYLVTLGFFGVGWFIDLVRIACGVFRDGNGRYV